MGKPSSLSFICDIPLCYDDIIDKFCILDQVPSSVGRDRLDGIATRYGLGSQLTPQRRTHHRNTKHMLPHNNIAVL